MTAIKALFPIAILLATFVAVVIGGEDWFEPSYTVAEKKCIDELEDSEASPCKVSFFDIFDDAFWSGDECDIYLTKYKCFDDAFVNGTQACDAEIQKSIWKTTELQYEALFSTNETLLSFPECHCLLEFFQKKNNKESSANTLKQCSDYKKLKECTDGIRGHCYPKISKDDHHNRSQCMDIFALYKCYDDQFQNTASCNDDMRKPFWEKEHRAFVHRLAIEENCQAAIQYIDEKICDADKECNSNGAIAFGVQSAVIGLTAIVAIFLKNMAILDHMSYL